MKQIDHDKYEFTRPKWEAWDKEKANFEKDYGRELTPGDLVRWLAPFVVVSVVLFLYREGWPF